MKTIVSFFICFGFMWSELTAQSEAGLCRLIDSLDHANEVYALVAPSDALRQMVKKDGLNDTFAYARSQIKVADALRILNRYQKADTLFKELDLLLPAESVERASWLVASSVNDIILGTGEAADSILKAGLDMHQKLGNTNSLEYMLGLSLKAAFEQYYNENGKCEETCLEAIALWKKYNLPEHPTLGIIYCLMANAYYNDGFGYKSKNAMTEGLAVYSRTCKPDHPGFLFQLSDHISSLIKKQELEEAERLLAQIKQTLPHLPSITPILKINLLVAEADLKSELGLMDEALRLRQEAVAFSSANMPFAYTVYMYQAAAIETINCDRHDDAEILLKAMADSLAYHEIQMPVHDAFIAHQLAECNEIPAKSIPLLEKALSIYQELTGRKDAGFYTDVINDLSLQYMEANRLDDAEKTLSLLDSLESKANENDFQFKDYLEYNGVLCEQKQEYEKAWQYWRWWSSIELKETMKLFWRVNEMQQYESLEFLRQRNDLLLSALERKNYDVAGVLEYVLDFGLSTKSFLLENTKKIKENIEHGNDEVAKQLFDELKETRERLSWCYTQPKQRLAEDKISLGELETHADSLETELSRRNKDFREALSRQTFSWQDVQRKLAPGDAALEIVRFEYKDLRHPRVSHYAAFIIAPNGSQPHVLFLNDGVQFEQVLVEQYLSECARPKGEGFTSELYEAFWKKIEPYLQGISRIYVSNDGAFHKINLGAIRLPNGKYVADKYEVQPVFSLKDIHRVPQTANGERTAFLVGNPTFSLSDGAEDATTMRSATEMTETSAPTFSDPLPTMLRDLNESRGLKLDPLPGSQQEVGDLSNLLQRNGWQPTVLTGEAADEASVKSLHSPRLVHLATHGYFLANERSGTAGLSRGVLEKNPMLRSMLFFAGAQNTLDQKPLSGSTEDGILTAFEAQNLYLKNTELVVLSACQTAQGKVQNGEGVYGLQRALHIAGAESLLLTLWDVDDKIGQEFMRLFYEKWLGGSSKKDAFRWAQMKVKEKHPQPFYWAGFVLME